MNRARETTLKGFTLVELIVVIAIIAILATVSIVGFQSYIGRARLSNDVTDAKNMTNIIQAYSTRHNATDLDAAEVRAIVNIDNDYSFIPRVEGYSFWYDVDTQTVRVLSSYETMALEGDFTELTGELPQAKSLLLSDNGSQSSNLANEPVAGDMLEEVVEGYFLLDVEGSQLAESIYEIRNLRTVDDFSTITAVDGPLGQLGFETIRLHILANFDLNDTLFINDFFGLTGEGNDSVSKVVFADGIDVIPSTALASVTTLPDTLRIPDRVMIEKGAFTQMTSDTEIVARDVDSLQVETGAFRSDDTRNQELRSKESSIEIHDLNITTNTTYITSRFYSPIVEGIQEYYGKTVNTSIETPTIDDTHFLSVYSLYESKHWNYNTMVPYDSNNPDHDGYYTLTQEIFDNSETLLGKAHEYWAEDIYWPDPDAFDDATVGSTGGYNTLEYDGTVYPVGVMGWTDGETVNLTDWEVLTYRIEDTAGNPIGLMRKHALVENVGGVESDRVGYTFYDLTDVLIPVSSIPGSSFAGFSPTTNTYGTRTIHIQLDNGNAFSYPVSLVYMSQYTDSGYITVLGIPQQKTYEIYDGSHEFIGSYTATNYKYDISSYNYHWSGCVNMCFLNSYGGYVVSTSSPDPVINEASDANGDSIDPGVFESSPEYAFLFGDHMRTVTFGASVNVALKDNADVVIHEIHVVYRESNGTVICEAKGYDARGRLIAKGTASYVQTFVETNILD